MSSAEHSGPERVRPSLGLLWLSAAVSTFVAGLVLVLLSAATFLVMVLTSAGDGNRHFFSVASIWPALLVFPLSAITYVACLRFFSSWIANRHASWLQSLAGLAISIATALLCAAIGDPGVIGPLLGCLLVACFLRWRMEAEVTVSEPQAA